MKKLITGNEAVAYGALKAGAKVITGYPGTPSTGAVAALLEMDLPDAHVEWSTNEKVAYEIALGAAWAGHRALCTMKMSGVNVAYDSLVSGAYSGCDGGFVIFVADDPGISAGMVEQDSRGFAHMADMVMLEPASVAEAYQLTAYAFDLSEKIKTQVFVRLVTGISHTFGEVEIEEPGPVSQAAPLLIRDINIYTKAGAVIGMTQHRSLIERLAKAGQLIHEKGLNRLALSAKTGGLGVIACGAAAAYLDESFIIAEGYGLPRGDVSVLRVTATNPFPEEETRQLLAHCGTVLVLEELEPYIERSVNILARQTGFGGKITGKLDGLLSRIGEYGVPQVVAGLQTALGLPIPADLFTGNRQAEKLAAARPITVCAGCPHRGTYLAIDQAIRRLKYKKSDVMVTGDIGCTILGMNTPFETIWNEVSMGASVSLAQGFVHAGVKTPVIATIGDSTFFHGGIPGLINAIQNNVNLTLIIMDNGWTAMTGMQVNPGTAREFQKPDSRVVDLARLIPALGVDQFFVVDPFQLNETAATLQEAIPLPGVKVILARQECAIQAMRHGKQAGQLTVAPEKCNLCNLCILRTGCAALSLGPDTIVVDPDLCYGCGLCAQICNRQALISEPLPVKGA